MLHRRYVVRSMRIGGRSVALRRGDLVVAARAESGTLDWEAIVHTIEPQEVRPATHHLELACEVDDTVETFSGSAFLVRAVQQALVFRGDGPIDGVEVASLRG